MATTSLAPSPALDHALEVLQAHKNIWAALPVKRKIGYLRGVLHRTAAVAERQVAAAVKAKGIPPDSPAVAEEWLGGPMIILRNARLLIDSLEQVAAHGTPLLPPGAVRTRAGGQVVVDVFPLTTLDRLLYQKIRAEVWMQPGVTPDNLPGTLARFYEQPRHAGKLALVLGAGNVASIGPLDVLYKLFVEGHVCLLKLHPVNDYLGPFIEEAFSELLADGFLRTAYGGADVGAYLCEHDSIDEIHITGSDRTHDAIVFGPGDEGAERKRRREPRLQKRITSELGNTSPVIVVPGPWSDADLRFHAENVASQITNNASFNCNAAKVLILHDAWPQRHALMAALRATLAAAPQRVAYYPGALQRYQRYVSAHPQAEPLGDRRPGTLPWTLIPDVDPARRDDLCFTTESFCGVMAQTSLAGHDAAEFLRRAVDFCNDTLWGTLNACIIIHPRTAQELRAPLDSALADLRYGSIGLNQWPALSFALGSTTWGAYPGHTYEDIQSGIGVVHNTFMFDKPQKTVVYGPFRMWPKPPWFVTHRTAAQLAPKLARLEADPRLSRLPGILWTALRG